MSQLLTEAPTLSQNLLQIVMICCYCRLINLTGVCFFLSEVTVFFSFLIVYLILLLCRLFVNKWLSKIVQFFDISVFAISQKWYNCVCVYVCASCYCHCCWCTVCCCCVGTCINNTSIMMFKKGSFEIGGTIYPVAIKVLVTVLKHWCCRVSIVCALHGLLFISDNVITRRL